MVTIAQGDIRSADLGAPTGSGPGLRRPVVVVQGNALNRSRLATVVRDSVANASQIVALDRSLRTDHVGRLAGKPLQQVLHGIAIVLGG